MAATGKRIRPNQIPRTQNSPNPRVAVPQIFTTFSLAGQPTFTLASPCHFAAKQTSPKRKTRGAESNRILDLIALRIIQRDQEHSRNRNTHMSVALGARARRTRGTGFDDSVSGTKHELHHAALRGTFAPFLRASERPMAIACLRLLTFPPLPPLPLFASPRLYRCISRLTSANDPKLTLCSPHG